MKTYFLNLVTGFINLFILLSFAAVAASISYLPLAAMAGSALLFFIGSTVYLFRPKVSALITLVSSLLILPWVCGYVFELIKEVIQAPKDSFDYVPLGIFLIFLTLNGLTAYSAIWGLFKRRDIGWNSNNSKIGRIAKTVFSVFPFLLLLFRFLWRR